MFFIYLNRQIFISPSHVRRSNFQLLTPLYPTMATCFAVPIPFKPQIPNSNHCKAHRSQTSRIICSSITTEAKRDLLNLICDQDRGLKTQKDPVKRKAIIKAIGAMAVLGSDMIATGDSLSATWRMLWTTEKEQLFIIEKAYLFGTQAGDVLQVIDVEKRSLNNVITFPPHGVFFVRSDIEIFSRQRVNFRLDFVHILQITVKDANGHEVWLSKFDCYSRIVKYWAAHFAFRIPV